MLISYLAMIGTQHEKSEFVKMYERYRKLMHYAAKRILGDDSLAEEAVQEAFLRIAKNFGKVSGADQSATKKFVLIITENAAKALYRRESRHTAGREYPEDMEAAGACHAAGDPTAAGAETREAVGRILQMPELQQNVLFLHTVYGFSYREIAALLELPLPTVLSKYHRALKKMRSFLEGDDA